MMVFDKYRIRYVKFIANFIVIVSTEVCAHSINCFVEVLDYFIIFNIGTEYALDREDVKCFYYKMIFYYWLIELGRNVSAYGRV